MWRDGQTDARTDGRRLESHTISSPKAFGSGELKIHAKDYSEHKTKDQKGKTHISNILNRKTKKITSGCSISLFILAIICSGISLSIKSLPALLFFVLEARLVQILLRLFFCFFLGGGEVRSLLKNLPHHSTEFLLWKYESKLLSYRFNLSN